MANLGMSFIEFDIHSQTRLIGANTPPTLTIENCEFKNFIYEFSSFIELNEFGGHVSITNTKFSNFNNCGSVLRYK